MQPKSPRFNQAVCPGRNCAVAPALRVSAVDLQGMNTDQEVPVGPCCGPIRRFSDTVSKSSPREPLGRALAAKVWVDQNRETSLNDDWDYFLSEGFHLGRSLIPDEEAVLFEQSKRLREAWNKFRQNLPRDQKMEFRGRDRPDINYLFATVNRASETWKSNREGTTAGKIKAKFHALCETCNSHSALFATIPRNNEYVSLLTGSLLVIFQATINHHKIAEGVIETLGHLGSDIEFWNRQMNEHGDSQTLLPYVRELYVVIFEFFTEVFENWSKSGWKRFLTSFNEDSFNKLLTDRKDKILAIERRMERHMYLDFRRDMGSQMKLVLRRQEEILKMVPDQIHEFRYFLGGSLQTLSEGQRSLLSEESRLVHHSSPEKDPAQETTDVYTSDRGQSVAPAPSKLSGSSEYQRFSRAEIQAELAECAGRWRERFRHLIQVAEQASLLRIDKEVHHCLTSWLSNLDASNIWVQGPHGVPRPSQNSMTAVSLAALARAHDIPCVVFFCNFTGLRDPPISRRECLREFLTSLVLQLVQLMPEEGSSTADMSPARFSALARGDLDIGETLRLIRDVRQLGPRLVYNFIDSPQVLEDRLDRDHTRDVLRVIATLCRLGGDAATSENHVGRMYGTNICFTTDGYMDGLAQAAELGLIEKVEYELESTDCIPGELGGELEFT